MIERIKMFTMAKIRDTKGIAYSLTVKVCSVWSMDAWMERSRFGWCWCWCWASQPGVLVGYEQVIPLYIAVNATFSQRHVCRSSEPSLALSFLLYVRLGEGNVLLRSVDCRCSCGLDVSLRCVASIVASLVCR